MATRRSPLRTVAPFTDAHTALKAVDELPDEDTPPSYPSPAGSSPAGG